MMIFNLLFPSRAHRAPFYVMFPWPLSLAFEMALTIGAYALMPLAGLILQRRLRLRSFGVALLVLTLGEILMTLTTDLWSPGRHIYRPQYTAITLLAFLLGRPTAPSHEQDFLLT
jgi:hypothetical protein